MAEMDSRPQSDEFRSVPELLDVKYPNPIQLADVHTEDELLADLATHIHQENEYDDYIARLQEDRRKVRAELILTQMALSLLAEED